MLLLLLLFSDVALVDLQHRHERLLGNLNLSERFHSLLTRGLLFEQLFLSRDVPAVAFRQDVLSHGAELRARDDFVPNRGLDWDFELLSRNEFFEFID